MDTNSPVYHGLLKRRREIETLIYDLEDRLTDARGEILHLNAALSILGYDVPSMQSKRKTVGTAGLFTKNELPRTILIKLRANPDGLTCKQIAEQIIQDKGWGVPEQPFVIELSAKIGKALARMRRRYANVDDKKVGADWIWKANSGNNRLIA